MGHHRAAPNLEIQGHQRRLASKSQLTGATTGLCRCCAGRRRPVGERAQANGNHPIGIFSLSSTDLPRVITHLDTSKPTVLDLDVLSITGGSAIALTHLTYSPHSLDPSAPISSVPHSPTCTHKRTQAKTRKRKKKKNTRTHQFRRMAPKHTQDPIPEVESLADVYSSKEAVLQQGQRWDKITQTFQQQFQHKPTFIARAPGRVNVIGKYRTIHPALAVRVTLEPTSSALLPRHYRRTC